MASSSNNNYRRTQLRSSTRTTTTRTTTSQQTIRYLVMNPLAINYIIKQDVQASGDNTTIHAEQQYTN